MADNDANKMHYGLLFLKLKMNMFQNLNQDPKIQKVEKMYYLA
jgi:hypothetical protein